MKRYLLDTNAASDFIYSRRGVVERATEARSSGSIIGIGMPVLAELLGGAEHSGNPVRSLAILNRNLRTFRLWPFNIEAARIYGRLFAEMRRIGRPIEAMDLMIAATAFSLGNCAVVTSDGDFSAVPGLVVENWITNPKYLEPKMRFRSHRP
jgi:tRNA(fMet)-specific endonuclease VapC